jgi:hypothetical protein
MGIVPSFLILLITQSSAIPAGTALEARLESSVQTAASAVGDRVTAVVTSPIPKGARLSGRIETIQPATQTSEGRVRLVFREIQLPDGRLIQTWITNSFDASAPRRHLRYGLLMAVGGIAGGLIGGNAARVAGILGGALIGFVIGENSGNSKLPDVTLKPGQILHLQLGEDLTIN